MTGDERVARGMCEVPDCRSQRREGETTCAFHDGQGDDDLDDELEEHRS